MSLSCATRSAAALGSTDFPKTRVFGLSGVSERARVAKSENFRSRFLGRGCDEALFSEKKGFSVKRGEAIQ